MIKNYKHLNSAYSQIFSPSVKTHKKTSLHWSKGHLWRGSLNIWQFWLWVIIQQQKIIIIIAKTTICKTLEPIMWICIYFQDGDRFWWVLFSFPSSYSWFVARLPPWMTKHLLPPILIPRRAPVFEAAKITSYISFCSWKGQCKAVNWKVIPDVTQRMKTVWLLLIITYPVKSTCTLKIIWELYFTNWKGPICSELIFRTVSDLSGSFAHLGLWIHVLVWEARSINPLQLFTYKSLRSLWMQWKMILGMVLSFCWMPSNYFISKKLLNPTKKKNSSQRL